MFGKRNQVDPKQEIWADIAEMRELLSRSLPSHTLLSFSRVHPKSRSFNIGKYLNYLNNSNPEAYSKLDRKDEAKLLSSYRDSLFEAYQRTQNPESQASF